MYNGTSIYDVRPKVAMSRRQGRKPVAYMLCYMHPKGLSDQRERRVSNSFKKNLNMAHANLSLMILNNLSKFSVVSVPNTSSLKDSKIRSSFLT